MNLDSLNRWLALGANVGVVAGLIVLILELNQSRDLVRAQTRNEVSMGFLELSSLPATNVELASVLRRGNTGEALSPDEEFQFRRFNLSTFRYYENVHYQYRQGLYDEVEFSKQRGAWASYATRSPGAARIWCDMRDYFSSEFVADNDEVLRGAQCEPIAR